MSESKITRAAVLRLYPNQQQASALRRWQGGLRYVWNAALDCVFTSRDINGRWPTMVETLNVKGWAKNRSISKSTADASVGMFLSMLRYKADWAARTLVEVGQWEPTSKTCSDCGTREPGVVLGVSRWVCSACGAIHDRDHNAAKNIYAYGEERRNVTGHTVKSAWTGGDQAGAIPPVPQDETRILKQAARESNPELT